GQDDQQRERSEATAAGRHLEHAGLLAISIQHRPDVEALQERSPSDVFGELLDRDAGFDSTHVGLAEHQLVEGNIARSAESDLGGWHVDVLREGPPRASLSASNPSRTPPPRSEEHTSELQSR